LAAQGFNICIVSRDAGKIAYRLQELRDKYPNIETLGVEADLANLTTVAEYQALVREKLSHIDIALLVLNAGVMQTGVYLEQNSDADVESTMAVNGLHVAFLAKALIGRLRERVNRSGIIIVSSGLANVVSPGIATYCATKAMVTSFGVGLHYEEHDKVDVLVWEAGAAMTGLGHG